MGHREATIRIALTRKGAKLLLRELSRRTMQSYLELSKNSGIHFTTVYGFLRDPDPHERRSVRFSTIRELARAAGYEAEYDSRTKEVIARPATREKLLQDELEEFALDIAATLRGLGKESLTSAEKEKIRKVLVALIS